MSEEIEDFEGWPNKDTMLIDWVIPEIDDGVDILNRLYALHQEITESDVRNICKEHWSKLQDWLKDHVDFERVDFAMIAKSLNNDHLTWYAGPHYFHLDNNGSMESEHLLQLCSNMGMRVEEFREFFGIPKDDLGRLADWFSGEEKCPVFFSILLALWCELTNDGRNPTESKDCSEVYHLFAFLAKLRAAGKLPY